jgi:hypothetical protein
MSINEDNLLRSEVKSASSIVGAESFSRTVHGPVALQALFLRLDKQRFPRTTFGRQPAPPAILFTIICVRRECHAQEP